MSKFQSAASISKSRQFPTGFFSAYEVIPKDLDDFKKQLEEMNNPKPKEEKEKEGKKKEKAETIRKPKKNKIPPAHMPSAIFFKKYRDALDTAVKLATIHNVE